MNREEVRGAKEKERWLAELIVEYQRPCRHAYGIRRVRHWIQRQTGKTANVTSLINIGFLLGSSQRREPKQMLDYDDLEQGSASMNKAQQPETLLQTALTSAAGL